jgi:hypothetical protein
MPRKQRHITVHTIESLLARTEEVGDCLEWQGYTQNLSPQVSHNNKMRTVRQLIAELQGFEIKGMMFVAKCGNPRCVNPEHIQAMTVKQHTAYACSKVDMSHPVRVQKLRLAAQARGLCKIPEDELGAIFLDPRSCSEVAADYGVSKSLIARKRRKFSGPKVSAQINPFAQLMR